jgi:hypothetical protein
MTGTFKTLKRAIGVLAIAASLVGCATAAQRQYQAMASNNRTAVQDLQECSTTIYNSPEFAPLRKHAPYKASDATLEQLSDNSLATDEEVKTILEIHPQLQSCRKQALDRIAQSTPTLIPIWLGVLSKSEDSLIDLIQKKQSWGSHVRRARDLTIAATVELQTEGRRIVAGLQQSHEAELAQRQRAAEALAQWAQTQQMINAMNRPVITNCNEFGSIVNCVSR